MLPKIEIHKRGLETRREGVKNWKVPQSIKKDILRFLDELELGKVNKGRRIGESRLTKYLDLLKIPLEYFKKSVDALTVQDIERFEKRLSSLRS